MNHHFVLNGSRDKKIMERMRREKIEYALYMCHIPGYPSNVSDVARIMDQYPNETVEWAVTHFVNGGRNAAMPSGTTPDWVIYDEEVPCSHYWVPYKGFTEEYEFCTKCDKRKS